MRKKAKARSAQLEQIPLIIDSAYEFAQIELRNSPEGTVINNGIGVAYCASLQSPTAPFSIFAYQPGNKTRRPFHRCLYTRSVLLSRCADAFCRSISILISSWPKSILTRLRPSAMALKLARRMIYSLRRTEPRGIELQDLWVIVNFDE